MASRASEVGLALAALAAGNDVVVEGAWGVGKSTLLGEIARQLNESGRTPVEIAGMPDLAASSGASLRLAGLVGSPGRAEAAAQVDQVAASWAGHPSVLIIDDADDVDAWSWGILETARRRTGTPVVAARTVGLGAPDVDVSPATRLADAVHVVLEPLAYTELADMMAERYGAGFDTELLSRVLVRSGGLPRLATAILDIARLEGRVVEERGRWSERGGLWSPALAGVVAPLLAGLAGPTRDALQVLAHVGAMPVASVVELIGEEQLGELERRGLAVTSETDDRVIVVHPALIEEVLLRSTSDDRRNRASRRVAEVFGAAETGAQLELTRLGTRSAVELTPGPDLVRIAQARQGARVAALAAQWRRTRAAADAVPYIVVLLQVSRDPHGADEVWAETKPSRDPYVKASFAQIRARWVALHESLDDALKILDQARTGSDADVALNVEELRLRSGMDAVPHDYDHLLDVPETAPPVEAELARLQSARVLLMLGQVERAEAVAQPVSAEAAAFGGEGALVRGLARIARGQMQEAVAHGKAHLDDAVRRLDIADIYSSAYVVGCAAVLSGDYIQTRQVLTTALAFGPVGPAVGPLERGCISLAALAEARLGNAQASEALVQQATTMDAAEGPFPGMSIAWVLGERRRAEGDLDGAADVMWESTQKHIERNWLFVAATEGFGSMEASARAERVGPLVELVRRQDVPMNDILLGYIVALGKQSPVLLLESSMVMSAAGMYGRGYAAARAASAAAERVGDDEVRRAALAQEQELIGVLGPDNVRAAYPAGDAPLTERERDVVRLAVAGMSNSQIADRLVLSVRTVENHLHRVFRKTGARSRDDLAKLLQGRGITI